MSRSVNDLPGDLYDLYEDLLKAKLKPRVVNDDCTRIASICPFHGGPGLSAWDEDDQVHIFCGEPKKKNAPICGELAVDAVVTMARMVAATPPADNAPVSPLGAPVSTCSPESISEDPCGAPGAVETPVATDDRQRDPGDDDEPIADSSDASSSEIRSEPASPPPAPAKESAQPCFILPDFAGCSESELQTARLHPKCIVDNLYFADVGTMFAPGGVGKTTTKLYESICIALQRPVWGYQVQCPGKTLLITAEDQRELCLARMQQIMLAMHLTPVERSIVRTSIMILDVSGDICRLAECDASNNLIITGLADSIAEKYQNAGLSQVIFDPAIRFGPGERYVNDGDDAIIIACRRIVRQLDCLVQLIHHTGKENARNGSLDQYSGRGGSAFSDGCRMVTVLSGTDTALKNAPEGFEILPGDSAFVMARPKLSYTPPQPNIWIRRHGWEFDYTIEDPKSSDDILAIDMERIATFLRDELHHGRRYALSNLETKLGELKMTRSRLKNAISSLEVCGRVTERELPEGDRHGRRKTYLHPLFRQ